MKEHGGKMLENHLCCSSATRTDTSEQSKSRLTIVEVMLLSIDI